MDHDGLGQPMRGNSLITGLHKMLSRVSKPTTNIHNVATVK